ncbi:hypothetical protein L1987_03147 [Smallanthus sonchifolius]|uniref:Uncharacterized protein n=1 Tax=Smallanthus sonchifolius TaxID=185202 RepID=A0ACB9K9X8_9ASTR|nr:hypothetical protein L1987_03147 [Smallanthus sonchifolius]
MMSSAKFPVHAFIKFRSCLESLHSNSSSNGDRPRSKVTKLDDALNLFDEMIHKRPLPSVVKFTHLLNAVTKLKHFSCGLDLFKQMCVIGVPVNEYSMSIAIRCCCQLYRTNDGFALLGCCFRRAVVPNVFIFSTLLDGLVLEDRILEAERLFKKLIKQRLCEPDVVMYSTMIKGLCKFGNNVMAIGLLRLMDERGCKPNVVAYSTIIDSLCKDKMMDDAFKLFKEMVFDKGILPNVITYNSVICGLCNFGRWDEVSKMLKEMEDERISPDFQTFSILVDAFCKEGKVDEAEAVIDIMVERGEVPDIVTYSTLIDGYCLRGEMSKARTVFDSLMSRGLVPNVITYSSLLNGYCKKLNIEEAMLMFHEITKKGLKPNIVTYNTMLQGLFQVGRCGAARRLFDELGAQGQIPDSGCPPDNVTYRVLLQGYLKNQHYDDVEMLLQQMDGRAASYYQWDHKCEMARSMLLFSCRKFNTSDVGFWLFRIVNCYISCNPESLMANAIELCTPSTEKRNKKNKGWRSASLARQRAKSMPTSDPFQPIKAMAVDLFPRTPHCELCSIRFIFPVFRAILSGSWYSDEPDLLFAYSMAN